MERFKGLRFNVVRNYQTFVWYLNRENKFLLIYKNNPIESGLPSHLFWDVDIQQLDWETNARLIVERVIERGSYKDLLLIQEKYGKQRIGAILKQTVFMPPTDIWFVHIYFDIPLKSLKCYNGQF